MAGEPSGDKHCECCTVNGVECLRGLEKPKCPDWKAARSSIVANEGKTLRTDALKAELRVKYPDPMTERQKRLYYMEAAELFGQESAQLERELAVQDDANEILTQRLAEAEARISATVELDAANENPDLTDAEIDDLQPAVMKLLREAGSKYPCLDQSEFLNQVDCLFAQARRTPVPEVAGFLPWTDEDKARLQLALFGVSDEPLAWIRGDGVLVATKDGADKVKGVTVYPLYAHPTGRGVFGPDAKDAARYRFRHSNYKDAAGYEYGYCKVRWKGGTVESMLWASDEEIDAAMADASRSPLAEYCNACKKTVAKPCMLVEECPHYAGGDMNSSIMERK